MPIQTSVRPKIQREDSSSQGRPAPPCADCGATDAKHVTETYVVTKGKGGKPSTVARKELCGSCLIGNDVAVRRDGKSGMSFGEVKAYDPKLLRPFLVSFLKDGEEWAEVSRTPSTDYLESLGISQLRLPKPSSSPTKILANKSIGSFSSSSFSVAPPALAGTFPLFEDSKLPFLAKESPACTEKTLEERCLDESLSSSIYSDDDKSIELRPRTRSTAPRVAQPKSSTPKRRGKQSAPRSPVMWKPAEDKNLIEVVASFKEQGLPLKWHDVAQDVPGRNGKQCRERYMNHLSPSLKKSPWSPQEDATVFSLFFQLGAKWCKVAKYLPGRTDNGTKNRFHHIRRRLNKDVERKLEQYTSLIDDDESIASANDDSAPAIEQRTRKILPVLAKESKRGGLPARHSSPKMKGYVFGPFKPVSGEAKKCQRCGLFVPSAHTGESICVRTSWCEACAKIPPYVSHNLLRECLELRLDEEDGKA